MKPQTEHKKPESQYEKNQDFNLINRYLHSVRYKNLVQTINNFQVNTSRLRKDYKNPRHRQWLWSNFFNIG
jgi:hypothetical protein